jgi:hypothetical protein
MMAGRVTHWREWDEKEGGWEPAVTLKKGARIGLENALERKLTKDEIAAIEKDIAPIKFMKTGFPDAKSQDIKRSLGNIRDLLPDKAISAYRKSDSTTTALIDEAMCFNLGINPDSREWQHPSGESIAKAAAAALKNFSCGKGGRPRKLYREHLASYALLLWVRLGGSDCKAWERDDVETPIVKFMAALAGVVDDEILDMSTAAKLLNGAAKRKK